MNIENKELLENVIQRRLENTLEVEDVTSEEAKRAFEQATKAVTISNEVEKIENAKIQMEAENGFKDRELDVKEREVSVREAEYLHRVSADKKNFILRILEIIGIYALVPMFDWRKKNKFAEKCMLWETENTFTTTPGRSVRNFFSFRK